MNNEMSTTEENLWCYPLENETTDEYLWRVGEAKDAKGYTWEDLAPLLNDKLITDNEDETGHDESWWRKRFKRMRRAIDREDNLSPAETPMPSHLKDRYIEMEKQRIRVRDERASYMRALRQDARHEQLLDLLAEKIQAFEPPSEKVSVQNLPSEKGLLIMLSDLHYGLTFNGAFASYSPSIARERMQKYAARIREIARLTGVRNAHVALMGDMISGSIHQSIRCENRENIIDQLIGASECVAEFLQEMGNTFDFVVVSSVSGNHSRPEPNADNLLRSERLDALVPWYCKARLRHYTNITFLENTVEETFSVISWYSKTYVAVHGDFDPDLKVSAQKIQDIIGKHVDYLLAGHMHIADMRFENTGYIRNGAVVTGGDDYTAKKRLNGPAVQNVLLTSTDGVEAIFPIKLS